MKKEKEVYMYKKSRFPNKVIEKILRVINTVIDTDKRQGNVKKCGVSEWVRRTFKGAVSNMNFWHSPLVSLRVKFSFDVELLGIFSRVQVFQKLFF